MEHEHKTKWSTSSTAVRVDSAHAKTCGEPLAGGCSVSVKLMRIEPDENPERYGLSLQVLDAVVAPGTSESSVSTSPHSPHVFYELLTQEMPSPDAPPRYAALRFAHPMLFDRVVLSGRDQYFITLKINGVGACPAQRFVLQKNNRGQYEMRPAMYD